MSLGSPFDSLMPGVRVLLALDIDGTLVHRGNHPSSQVVTALQKLAAHSVTVVLATGRQLHSVEPVVAALGISDVWVVASDGALTARYTDSRRVQLSAQVFDPRPLAARLIQRDPNIKLAVEEVGVGYLVNRRFENVIDPGDRQQVVDAFPARVTMLGANSPVLSGAVLAEMAREQGLSCTGWDEFDQGWCDVAAPGLSKATGVEVVREDADVQCDYSVAVGDFHNDIDLLRWADVGIAMGHAPAEVKAVADHVTGVIEDDGLAPVLEALLHASQMTSR